MGECVREKKTSLGAIMKKKLEKHRFNHKGVLGTMIGTGQVNDNISFPPGANPDG